MGSQPPIAPDGPDLPKELQGQRDLHVIDHLALDRSVVRRVSLTPATAADVHLTQCSLEDVDLSGWHLARIVFEDVGVMRGSWANAALHEPRLRRVAFEGVRMTGIDFASGSLKDVSFRECRIDLASFRYAKLERVLFERCRVDDQRNLPSLDH